MMNWYNEITDTFMKRGYLREGQTIDEKIKEIAQHSENILKKEGFAKRLEEYLKKGYYIVPTPVWKNFNPIATESAISCLTGDTWINTKEGGGKKIEDLEVGDEVLTHKGRYRKVVDKMVRGSNDDIYELRVTTRPTPIKITGNHPVLTNKGWVRVDELDSNKHLIATNKNIEYVEKDYTLVFDNPSESEFDSNCSARKIESVDIDKDLAWAIGLWFAEGSQTICVNKRPNGLRLTVGMDASETIEKWFKIMCDKFGINGNIYQSEVERNGKTNRWLTCNVNSTIIGKKFKEEFGVGCKNKNLPLWLKELPVDLLKSFFEGFYLGDGKKGDRTNTFTISNPKLNMSLYEVGLKCGYRMGIQMKEKAGKLSTTEYVYRCDIYCNQGTKEKRVSKNPLIENDSNDDINNYNRFKLKKLDHNEPVYDITVEEDHSFSACGVVVHNCFGVFIDDSVESILLKAGEVGTQNKIGGGSSGYFGSVRHRGAEINGGGESNGSVSMMEIFETISNVISQPNRRGHFSATQDIEHFDADEFLRLRSEGHPIQELSFSVSIGDDFMTKLLKYDSESVSKMQKIVKCRFETGFPYIFFKDTVNKNTVDVYKDNENTIWHSNMCVSGDTKLLTQSGEFSISSLNNSWQNVWNGEEFTPAYIKKTGENQKLLKIKFSNGSVIDCTGYHRFYINHLGFSIERRAYELGVGDKIIDYNLPKTDNVNDGVYSAGDIYITEISKVDGVHDTFCFNEPKKHMGVFNGVLTGNCHEIALPNTVNETFVCNLLGMNIEKFDEWKDTDAIEVGIYFMDSMLTDFIDKNKDSLYMQPAVKFAERHRAMGMGASGYHNYLQANNIAFESLEAKMTNTLIFKTIKDGAYKASEKMAKEYGKPIMLSKDKYNRRHTTLLAVAPNTSSSFIMEQQSQSIEPHVSNYYIKDVAKTRITVKNKYLEKLLIELGKNTEEVWSSIMKKGGSVQHLDFLDEHQKKVFKTFGEISQLEILIQASGRQNFIDQSQSLNLMIPSNATPEDVTFLIIKAWLLGIKTLYYQLNVSAVQEFGKSITECESCAG